MGSTENIKIHDRSYIERRFRISNIVGIANVWISVVGIVFFLGFAYRNFGGHNSLVLIITPSIHIAFSFVPFLLFFLVAFERISDVKSKTLGSYKHKRVMELVDDVLRENFDEGQEIPSVYIISHVKSNAFAINSLLLNFIKKLNSISISKNLFDILSIPELKSVMAHEIGHFKRNIYIPDRIRFIPQLFLILSAYTLVVRLGLPAGPGAVVAYLFIFVVLKKIWMWPFRVFHQDIEYLSDLYAAERYGKLAFVNAMIKLYQLKDLDLLVNTETAKRVLDSDDLEVKDIAVIADRVKKKVGKRLYDHDYISHQVAGAFNSLKSRKRKPLENDEREKRNRALNLYLSKLSKIMDGKTVEWDEIDTHRYDGRIDAEEYEGLIEMLIHHPELKVFRSASEHVGRKRFGSHPALRKRILFVHHNCTKL